ncbi:MAG: hypothetical protein K0S01_3839 [Herbinix sp.]|jgi:hypothetical protein|nr:hypothetical protein [Herbinix sp.]
MNLLEIALIIIGIIIIVISCRLVDHAGKAAKNLAAIPLSLENSITEKDKKYLKDKMEELMSEISEETMIRTDDSLSKLSNEKIMALNEFSDQVLEKIKRNHEEVVFLYNMLNDKQKELKSVVKEIDTSKKIVKEILESKAVNTAKSTKNQASAKAATQTVTQASQLNIQAKQVNQLETTPQELPTLNSLSSNNNTEILALYSQGRSVIEISKLLDLGQGEVKLVIDLFKGKK